MAQSKTRRQWLETSAAGAAGIALGTITTSATSPAAAGGLIAGTDKNPIKVVIWDEQQPAQREAYDNFLGNQIAAHLKTQEGLAVQAVKLDDPDQGLSPAALNECRVLIWWGHVRNSEVSPETAKRIVERIKSGDLSLIALHSAHWSTPFVEAMNERARLDLGEQFDVPQGERTEVHEIPPPQRFSVPKTDERPTPFAIARKYPRGFTDLTLHLPYCCFPAYRHDGKPSQVRVLEPDHPIVKDVPRLFEIPQTEMYDEPFHVPEPDEVILEERWAGGEWFRSGAFWSLGNGGVFYFRPGHETYPIYKQPIPLRIITNAVRFLASQQAGGLAVGWLGRDPGSPQSMSTA
jgi:trehalose utilization protein